MQLRIDGGRLVSLLQRLDFVLSHGKSQFKQAHVFTQLGITFDTSKMIFSLCRDKIKAVKAQAVRIVLLPTYQGVIQLLGLTTLASVVLSLVRLHRYCLQYWLKKTYRFLANFKPIGFTEEVQKDLL